jgi:hypothetical protein
LASFLLVDPPLKEEQQDRAIEARRNRDIFMVEDISGGNSPSLGSYCRGHRLHIPPTPPPHQCSGADTTIISIATQADRGEEQRCEATRQKVATIIEDGAHLLMELRLPPPWKNSGELR